MPSQGASGAGFDLVIRDGSACTGAVLQHILGVPAVIVLPFPLFQPAGYWFTEMSNPVAYVPQGIWGKTPEVGSLLISCLWSCSSHQPLKGRSCIVTPECCIEHDLHVAHLARLSDMQGIIDRLLNLGAAVMWRQLLFMPAWKDMRAICRKHGFDPPELSPRKSGAAASIAVTDWAFETPQPVPRKVHVRAALRRPVHRLSWHVRALSAGC